MKKPKFPFIFRELSLFFNPHIAGFSFIHISSIFFL